MAIALYLPSYDPHTLYAVSMLFPASRYGGVDAAVCDPDAGVFPGGNYGQSVFGIVAMISTLGMAIGAPLGGWLFDRFGGYGWLFAASSAIGVSAAVITITVRAHRVPMAAVSAMV